jgi:hypothetical protein
MNSTEKSKKSDEKLNNSDKEKNNNEKIINNLNRIEESFNIISNNNKFINVKNKNNDSKNSHSFESNNKTKNEKDNSNMKIKLEKNKSVNIINDLVKDGIISLKKNTSIKDPFLDINKIEYMNYEKIIKKIIDLNRSLNSIQIEKFRLNNERNIFSKGLNEINQKRTINDTKEKLSFTSKDDKNYNLYNYNTEEHLLNHFEEDINFFEELMKEFNNDLNIIK